jgi:hypothetical protein
LAAPRCCTKRRARGQGQLEDDQNEEHRAGQDATAARILAIADPGEVLVSTVTRDLADGAGLVFEDRGRHRLKGIRREHELFAVRG